MIVLLGFVGFIFGIAAYGYEIRILKSSLAGFGELPEFNAMFDMFIDGLKVLIVYSFFNPFDFDFSFWDIIFRICFSNNGNEFLHNVNMILSLGILIIFALLYLIIIFPILLISLAHMAYNNGELGAAFKFGEILSKISYIGWGNFIILYIVSGVIYLILRIIGAIIKSIFNLIHLNIIGGVLFSLISSNIFVHLHL